LFVVRLDIDDLGFVCCTFRHRWPWLTLLYV